MEWRTRPSLWRRHDRSPIRPACNKPLDSMSASPKPKLVPADLALWRKAFLDLRPSVSPCPGLTGANWATIHENAVTFLDRWADEAVRLGWTTLDLFGVHPEAGTIRPDYCGALIIGAEPVSAITETRMRFVNTTFYRDMPGKPSGGVPLWQFGKSGKL
jgi:hypothetical protein